MFEDRPILGPTGSLIFEIFVEVLELTSIVLGFYAILHTSSAPLIEAEDDSLEESRLFVELTMATRAYVVAAISTFVVVFLLNTVVRRFIQLTPFE